MSPASWSRRITSAVYPSWSDSSGNTEMRLLFEMTIFMAGSRRAVDEIKLDTKLFAISNGSRCRDKSGSTAWRRSTSHLRERHPIFRSSQRTEARKWLRESRAVCGRNRLIAHNCQPACTIKASRNPKLEMEQQPMNPEALIDTRGEWSPTTKGCSRWMRAIQPATNDCPVGIPQNEETRRAYRT